MRKPLIIFLSLSALATAMFLLGGRRADAQVNITAQVPPLSTDDTLSALTVSAGILSPAFAPGMFSYTDTLPYGTNAAPTVTAVTNNPSATDGITQASALPGSATILVTAADGTTSQTYIVSFTVASAPVVTSSGGGSSYDLAINNGAATTISPNVTLSLYGTAAYTMEVSNASTFAGAAWIPYATTIPWTLAPNPGPETVYAQFRSVAGTTVGTAQASINFVPAGTPLPAPSPTQIPTLATSMTSSTASLLAEIASLQAQLAALLKQAAQSAGTSPSAHFAFTRNLSLWMTGTDVKVLQQFLISQASGPAAAKLKAHGASQVFGFLTYNALAEFQEKAGIVPASGYFGPKTRAWVNSH